MTERIDAPEEPAASPAAGEAATEKAAATASETPRKRGITRRSLCYGIGGIAVLAALGAVNVAGQPTLVRPPGGQDTEHLISACIRCERCVEACPRNVITPAHIEDGLIGMRMPVLNFEDDYCDWCADENGGVPLCVAACPTHALQLPLDAAPETTILGIADLDTDLCIAHRQALCRSCYDACPYEAMELDDAGRPVVIPEKCNGCGACEAACVSLKNASVMGGTTRRAIVVLPGSGEEF